MIVVKYTFHRLGTIFIMFDVITAFLIFLLAFSGIAVGIIFNKKPIKGSCGGLNNLSEGEICQYCGQEGAKTDS